MKTVTVTIVELPAGWLWKETGQVYKTAAGAFAAVTRDAKRFHQNVAHVVTWEPTSAAGAVVVRALG